MKSQDRYQVDLQRSLCDSCTAGLPLHATPVLAAAPLPDASLHNATQPELSQNIFHIQHDLLYITASGDKRAPITCV
jgi:hypothetical protein